MAPNLVPTFRFVMQVGSWRLHGVWRMAVSHRVITIPHIAAGNSRLFSSAKHNVSPSMNFPLFSGFRRFWAKEKNLTVFLFFLLAAIVLLPLINDLHSPNRLLVDSFFAALLLSGVLSVSSNRFLIWFIL